MIRAVILLTAILAGSQAKALELDAPFENIDGGTLAVSQWRGQPVLVVNTASRCAFTRQYAGLQALYDAYRDRGLIVLAVPSDDFQQELSSNAEVKEFCELQYGIDLPMTGITTIIGSEAHPFYRSLKAEAGYSPTWNFSKVLIGPRGDLVATFGSMVKPGSEALTSAIDELLR